MERFRTATGRELSELEAEKASTAALSGRTQAQAALNAALHEQLALAREQRAAAEAAAELRTSQATSLTARVAELEVSSFKNILQYDKIIRYV